MAKNASIATRPRTPSLASENAILNTSGINFEGLADFSPPLATRVKDFILTIHNTEARLRTRLDDITLLDTDELARRLSCSKDQIGRWTREGKLTAVYADRRPRYRLEEVQRFISTLPHRPPAQ